MALNARIFRWHIPCEWLIPVGSNPKQVFLYLHGGGFTFGLYTAHRWMCAYMAKVSGCRILAVDYRLAPEHPYPAALDDCETVYRWLLKLGIEPENIIIGGDSAGGNLTITTLLRLRKTGDPLPAGAICLSPIIDMECTGDSIKLPVPLINGAQVLRFAHCYVGQSDPHDPQLSPFYADLHGLPPLLIHVGEQEALLSDAQRLAHLAQRDSVSVRLEIYKGMWHVWHIFAPFLPQANQALLDIAGFLHQRLQR